MLKRLLTHPLTRGLDLDDPRTTALRRRILHEKRFLHKLYQQWYELIREALPSGEGPVLEVGSGAGFFREVVSDVIQSDLVPLEGLSLALDAQRLPFREKSLRAIVMTDALHHFSEPERFFHEAGRAVHPGGAVIMIEPWVTPWSRFVWKRFHHEPFLPDSAEWTVPSTGPLSGANIALPWILFERDRGAFQRRLPEWKLASVEPCMPFSYLLSGGVSLRSLAPGWAYGAWRTVERRMGRWRATLGMFARIVLHRGGCEQAPGKQVRAVG